MTTYAIRCSDTGCTDPNPLGTVELPDRTPIDHASIAAWGYLCSDCSTRLATRRAAWIAAHPGQIVPEWSLTQLTNPQRPRIK